MYKQYSKKTVGCLVYINLNKILSHCHCHVYAAVSWVDEVCEVLAKVTQSYFSKLKDEPLHFKPHHVEKEGNVEVRRGNQTDKEEKELAEKAVLGNANWKGEQRAPVSNSSYLL